MAKVIIGAGSNLGDRLDYLKQAGTFLSGISLSPVVKSSVWESEPVGPAEYSFLNSVTQIETSVSPQNLLYELKLFENRLGREPNPKRWGPRILDLDIITYNSLVIQEENLIIPHPEYQRRLFVLLPLRELHPEWHDPASGDLISTMLEKAPRMEIRKTQLTW